MPNSRMKYPRVVWGNGCAMSRGNLSDKAAHSDLTYLFEYKRSYRATIDLMKKINDEWHILPESSKWQITKMPMTGWRQSPSLVSIVAFVVMIPHRWWRLRAVSNWFAVIRLIFRTEEEAIANLNMKVRVSAISIIMKNIKVNGTIAKNVVAFLGTVSLNVLLKIGWIPHTTKRQNSSIIEYQKIPDGIKISGLKASDWPPPTRTTKR